jgi:RimJ/RimL family protein N-acetyltransferase
LILDATCDMSWGDTGVVDDKTPAPILTDGVVMLRPLVTDDAPAWLAGEDEEQRRWFEAPRPSQLNDVQRFIAECQTSWRTLGSLRHWGIWSLDPYVLVGGVELRELESDEVNLSYLVFPGKRRRGFAFRAAQLALEYARASLDGQAVVIKMLTGNESSRNLALALGAHHFGEEPSDSGATFDVFRLWLHDTPKEE